MSAILKTTVGSLVVCAAVLLIAVAIGFVASALALNFFGAITVVVLIYLGNLVFLPVFMGYATGTIADAFARTHSVLTAIVAATLICGVASAAAIAWNSFDRGAAVILIGVVIATAAVRARHLRERRQDASA